VGVGGKCSRTVGFQPDYVSVRQAANEVMLDLGIADQHMVEGHT
jgi:hypothetical protein